MIRLLRLLCLGVLLQGCASLPATGPSSGAISSQEGALGGGYAVVRLDYALTERLRLMPPLLREFSLQAADREQSIDRIGAGDVLQVAILEPSGATYSGTRGAGSRPILEALPPLTVAVDGRLSVPLAGRIPVAGLTPLEAEAAIRQALSRRLVRPEVIVSLAEVRSQTVTVLGVVDNAGPVSLRPNTGRLLDVIAAAGGSNQPPEDVLVTLSRDGQRLSAALSDVLRHREENIRLLPGDVVDLQYRPRRYNTFGALGQVTQTDIGHGDLTLASALSRAGGLNPEVASAQGVYVFRFEDPARARIVGANAPQTVRGVPVVYHLSLADPTGVFAANNFRIRADDILYVAPSRSAELRRFFELVQSVTRVVYDVTVTSALNIE